MAGGSKSSRRKTDCQSLKGPVSRNQREPLCTATPWINHPMGPTGGGLLIYLAPPMRKPSLGCTSWGGRIQVAPCINPSNNCSSNQDTLEHKGSGQKQVCRGNPPKVQELSLLGRESSRAAVRLRNHEIRIPRQFRQGQGPRNKRYEQLIKIKYKF